MIKEIDFKSTRENEFLYLPITIDTIMEQPFKLNIELLQEIDYFHEKLSSAPINILDKVPQADYIRVNRWIRLVCVSKKFKDIFENKLKGYWYPTNYANYFIFLLDNCIHGLDEEKTIIINKKERAYWYESIENGIFKPIVEQNEYLFSVVQEPLRKLSTSQFENLYRVNNLTGIQFYKDLNFKRKDESRFDGLRFKEYDDEGNCLDNS